MPTSQFTAFYPSKAFWAGSEVNFEDQSEEGWFHDQMVEEVFSRELASHTIKVCRDGRIMIRVESLEEGRDPKDMTTSIEESVKIWGEYLDYLNTFYLLLSSSTMEIMNLSFFNLHEITNRDAFRMTYKEGKSVGENIAFESIASVFQMNRYLSSYRLGVPIESNFFGRRVITIETIERTSQLFEQVISEPGLEKTLASYAKSLSEYKVGNYETSVVLAWFITEAIISGIWKDHIDSLNMEFPDGSKRINRERSDTLTGSNFSISIVSNFLELWGVLPNDIFQDIDSVRGYRNKIVHGHNFRPSADEAQLALKTAHWMIESKLGFKFTSDMGYSIAGL